MIIKYNVQSDQTILPSCWPKLKPCPHVFEKGEFFAPFSKHFRDHTLRFLIVFARPHKNAIVTENGTIFDGSIRIYWYPTPRRNRSVFICPLM